MTPVQLAVLAQAPCSSTTAGLGPPLGAVVWAEAIWLRETTRAETTRAAMATARAGTMRCSAVTLRIPPHPGRQASCWGGVIERLQSGPAIVAGHSYGGQIMTALGPDAPNMAGLVYIAAFGLDQGSPIPVRWRG